MPDEAFDDGAELPEAEPCVFADARVAGSPPSAPWRDVDAVDPMLESLNAVLNGLEFIEQPAMTTAMATGNKTRDMHTTPAIRRALPEP